MQTVLRSFLGLLIGLSGAWTAQGAIRTVTNLNDTGPGSLREMIATVANSGDTIRFSVTGTIAVSAGDMDFHKNLIIEGPGTPDLLTLSGAGSSRFFNIYPSFTVQISNMTFSNGKPAAPSPPIYGEGGGAIKSKGQLTVIDCVFKNNAAPSEYGGAILNFAGTLTVTSCAFNQNGPEGVSGGAIASISNTDTQPMLTVTSSSFTENTSPYGGGAIESRGNAVVNSSTFTRNWAKAGGLFDSGGGAISTSNGQLEVKNCTFDSNLTSKCLGFDIGNNALGSDGHDAVVTVTNCTFSRTTVTSCGTTFPGAIYNHSEAANLAPQRTARATIYNCSLQLSAIRNDSQGAIARIELGNNILASSDLYNSVSQGGDPSAGIFSSGYNIKDGFGSSYLNGTGDKSTTDLKLDPAGLADNGGPTRTIALTLGSPAIDQGFRFGSTTDQRGSPRPVDNPAIPNAMDGSDMGAFEAPALPSQGGSPSFIVTTIADHNDGVCGDDCTLREAVARSNQVAGANTITFTTGLAGVIPLGAGELILSDDTTITGPGARLLALSGSNRNRILSVLGGASTISGLTFRDGLAYQGAETSNVGGAIYIETALTLTDCTLSNNTVRGGDGVPLSNHDGGWGRGGAIFNGTILNLTRCTFRDNAANGGAGATPPVDGVQHTGGNGGPGLGGAVFNDVNGTLSASNCTFAANSATGGAGANGDRGGNGAEGVAGLFNQGSMTIASCTVTANTGNGGANGRGQFVNGTLGKGIGGIRAEAGSSEMRNALVAGNSRNRGGGPDTDGAFTSTGYNLIGIGNLSTGFTTTGDQVGTSTSPLNPQLLTLANNGGPTDTVLLLVNSPALDRGNTALPTDQRGSPRPVDTVFANATSGGGNDIGAVEMNLLGGPDIDGDGMSDDYEDFFGLTSATADADNDGMSNRDEFQAGTNPLDSLSAFRVQAVTRSGSAVTVAFGIALPGKGYQLERRDSLIPTATWGPIPGVSNISPSSTGSAQITDPGDASISKRFYRVRVLP